MPVNDLIVDCFFADRLTVLLVQACVSAEQSRLCLVTLINLVQELHIVRPVLVLLALREVRAPLVLALRKPGHSKRKACMQKNTATMAEATSRMQKPSRDEIEKYFKDGGWTYQFLEQSPGVVVFVSAFWTNTAQNLPLK